MAFAWNPNDQNLYATSSYNNKIDVWDIQGEKSKISINLGSYKASMMEWCPSDESIIAVIMDSYQFKIVNLQTAKVQRILQFTASNAPTIGKWHPKRQKLFAFGCADSTIYFYNYSIKKSKKYTRKNKLGVADMCWNPRQNYIIVAFKDGSLQLTDDQGTEIIDFDRQGIGISQVRWIDNMSGDFITTSSKVGALRLWNASHKAPKSIIKVGSTGIKSFFSFPNNPNLYLLAFRNGAVGIYNLSLKKLQFCTEAGHTETIFDLAFKPDNQNIMATVSYDGSAKLWNVETMKLFKTLTLQKIDPNTRRGPDKKSGLQEAPKMVFYGIAWGPQPDDTRIAISNNLGQLLIFDFEKQRIIGKFQHSEKRVVIKISWNSRKPNLIAMNCDRTSYILEIRPNDDAVNGEVLQLAVRIKLQFPSVLFGVQWNPHIPSQIAISGSQGFLRIFDIDVSKDQPIKVLKGHQGRVANVSWSPHFGQLLASSSDDCTVRVWNTITDDVRILQGHTQNTRAVTWNYDIPWLLISGSWDSSIRVWDIRSSDVIYVIYDHIADVYGIASHPNRPFVYSSCSRDTSIRLWNLQGFVSPLKLKLILRYQLDKIHSLLEEGVSSPEILLKSIMSQQESNGYAVNEEINLTQLAGKASSEIVMKIKSPAALTKLQGVKELLDYMGIFDGQKEIISTLGAILQGVPCDLNARVVHVSDSMSNCKAKAEQLASATTLAFLGTELAKKEDRIMECAKLSLQMGDFRRHCQLLMQIGEYSQAMAFAPLVSLEYWKEIAVRVAQSKKKESLREASSYFLAANQIDESVKCLSSSQLFQQAKLVKALDQCKIYKNYTVKRLLQDAKQQQEEQFKSIEDQMEKLKITKNIQEIKILNDLVNQQADALFIEGKQVLAAAAHLSVNDINGCMLKLYRANQFYMAYIISSLLSHSSQIELAEKLAERAERFRLPDLSANIYSTFQMKRKLGLLIARLRNTQHQNAQDLAQNYKIKTPDYYKQECEKYMSGNAQTKLIFNYIMSGDIQNAAKLAATIAKQAFTTKNVEGLVKLFQVFQILEEARINKIGQVLLKAEVLMYAAAIGALKAIFLGYIRVITPLIGTVFSICEHQKIKPGFNLAMLQNIQSDINQYMLKERKKKLSGLQKEKDLNQRDKYLTQIKIAFDKKADEQLYTNILQALRIYYKQKGDMIKQGNNSFLTIGSTLPVNVNLSGVRKSIFSMEVIKGLYFVLEDGTSHMSIQQALEWAEVNRYSPLNNGCRINPF